MKIETILEKPIRWLSYTVAAVFAVAIAYMLGQQSSTQPDSHKFSSLNELIGAQKACADIPHGGGGDDGGDDSDGDSGGGGSCI